MIKYSEFQPTGFDRKGISLHDQQNWLVLDCVSRNRDSDLLTNCNFDVALETLGGEGKSVEVHRFGHWGCGWFEIILISPRAEKEIAIAEDIERTLSDYPVLCDDEFSKLEYEAQREHWESSGYQEVENLIRNRFNFSEVEYKQSELVKDLLENQYSVMTGDGELDTKHIEHTLDRLSVEDIFPYLTLVEFETLEDFENLPHSVYHLIVKHGIKTAYLDEDYKTKQCEVPDFITIQYNENQLCISGVK